MSDDVDREKLWSECSLEELADEAQVALRQASEVIPDNHPDAPNPDNMELLADKMREKL